MLKGLRQSKNTRDEKDLQNQPQTIKKMAIGTYINNYFKCKWIDAPTKRHRLTEWIQKQDPNICCLQETHFRPNDIQTESERMEKYISRKWEAKES